LHVPRAQAMLHENGSYGSSLDPESKIINYLRETAAPAVVYFDDPDSWVHGLASSEREQLQSPDAQVLLPLAPREELLGLSALGPKRSKEPYSGTDLQMLQTVAAQTALSLENSRLLVTVAEQAAQRERLHREMEIACDVQQRLFPQKYPPVM